MGSLKWVFTILSVWCPHVAESRGDFSWKLPEFGDVYHVSGIITIPFAEIEEPFEAWYNLTANKSCIQYYDGEVVTYQFETEGPWGANYKVTPETTGTETNVRKCFRINGMAERPAIIQSVFPNLDGFEEMTVLNHGVLAVGYGVLQGESYWLIKNSWSTHWGKDGYILLSMKDNNCGVTNAAVYPVIA